jgi:hypothetical protein
MIKPQTTKRETRSQIDSQVEAFLKSKGEITQAKMGESGLIDGKYNTSHIGFIEPKQPRTPLNYVVANIDKRKHEKTPSRQNTQPKRPKKKVIYDDFGDPIRWVWQE